MKKKIIIGVVILAIVGVGYGYFKSKAVKPETPDNGQASTSEIKMGHQGMPDDPVQTDLVVTDKGIVYSGKVVPSQIYYYSKDPSREFNEVYVKEGDIVEEKTTLFDYKVDPTIDAQIKVSEKSFTNLQQQLYDYYTRIDNFKKDLAGANQDDKVYINYLNVEINNTEGLIAQNKLEWLSTEEKIRKLTKQKTENGVKSDIGGLVYKINESTAIDPSNKTGAAYIVLYAQQKKVRISVSEFEYQLVKPGQKVTVKSDSLKKEFDCEILTVDTMPNNLESDDTSYYHVDIAIPDEIPYGYSVVVTVAKQ